MGPKPARAIRPHADRAASLLKALANEQRLMILCNLLEEPLSVRESNVVTTEREAQTIRYALPEGAVTQIIGILYKEFCAG